jgi:Flp pilus assembly pilin Flp
MKKRVRFGVVAIGFLLLVAGASTLSATVTTYYGSISSNLLSLTQIESIV